MSIHFDTRTQPLADSLRPRGPVQFEIVPEDGPDGTVLRAQGEVDVMTAPKLSAEIDSLLRTGRGDVIIDLTETTFLDSAGLHVLLNAARRLTRRTRRLRVVCGPGPVRHVIELARLGETLGVTDPEPRSV
jgi:anti-sigma B factor antagonist